MAGPDGSISINHGDIEAQAKNLADLKNELERTFQITLAQIKSLYEAGAFKSEAGLSFQDMYDMWNKEAGDVIAVLEQFSGYLTKANAAFTEVDQAFKIKL